MQYSFTPHGVCPRSISIEMDGNVVTSIVFEGGCDGNLQGIARLCEGRRADEIIPLLDGIRCDGGETSCPDQLARALLRICGQ